jgi:hypothetical protein
MGVMSMYETCALQDTSRKGATQETNYVFNCRRKIGWGCASANSRHPTNRSARLCLCGDGISKQTKGVLLDGTRDEWKCERAADNSNVTCWAGH